MPASSWLSDLRLEAQHAHRCEGRVTCQIPLKHGEKQIQNGQMGAWPGFLLGECYFITCH